VQTSLDFENIWTQVFENGTIIIDRQYLHHVFCKIFL